jgi:uncharacterized protein (DUF302 family)
MKNFHYTKTSKRRPDDALRMVQEEATKAGFAVIQTLDVQAILKSKGMTIPAAFIVELCEPALARTLIADDPLILHFLPCKILIFVEADQTVVSASMPLLMSHFMPRVDFSEIGPALESALMKIVDATS